MGVREDKYEVGSCVTGRFFTIMTIMDKITRFKWDLVNIYGAANAKDKSDFLVDLVHILNLNQLPILIGGDFNIIRRLSDRNKVKTLSKWTNIFNAIIAHWGLKELELPGQSFTWSNNQRDPLFARLDRVLVSPTWELHYPMISVRTLVRGVSDHAALLLDSGNHLAVQQKPFKFELCWLLREDLLEVVTKVWKSRHRGRNNLDRWHTCFVVLRRTLKGWNLNIEGRYRRERIDISRKLDFIDKQSEIAGLNAADYECRCSLQDKLNKILREEEIKWMQRAKERDLLEGDINTRYFMLKANGRKRRGIFLDFAKMVNSLKEMITF